MKMRLSERYVLSALCFSIVVMTGNCNAQVTQQTERKNKSEVGQYLTQASIGQKNKLIKDMSILKGYHLGNYITSKEDVSTSAMPMDGDELAIMELEHYLGVLKYYPNMLTGKKSPDLLTALKKFQADLSADKEREFTVLDYRELKDRYRRFVFMPFQPGAPQAVDADGDSVGAYGGWIYKDGGKRSSLVLAKISCILSKNICIEVDDFLTSFPGIAAKMTSTRFQLYNIVSQKDGKIIATPQQDQWGAVGVGAFPIFGRCVAGQLEINLPKTEVIRTTDWHVASSSACPERHSKTPAKVVEQLMDVRRIMIDEFYSNLQKRSYINSEYASNFQRLLSWLRERDVEEYCGRSAYALMYKNPKKRLPEALEPLGE